MKQERFKLHFLNIIKCIKHDRQELERGSQTATMSNWENFKPCAFSIGLKDISEIVKKTSFFYQVHDKVELDREVYNEENTGPAVLGVCWHHHIRETTKVKERCHQMQTES